MSDDEGLDFEESLTHKMVCSSLRKNGYMVMKNRPCKIVDMSTSNTGKHGHAKVHLVGIDIFTGKKYEEIVPSTHEVDVPNVSRNEYKLNGTDDDNNYLLLTDADGNAKNDVPVPEGDIGNIITDHLDNGDSCVVTVQGAMNEQACIAIKLEE